MSAPPEPAPEAAPEVAQASEDGTPHDIPRRAQTVGVVAWCSFLAAAVGTMLLFAFVDPAAVAEGDVPKWWTSRHTVYAIGFFFCWAIAALAAALTIYMAHTDRADSDEK